MSLSQQAKSAVSAKALKILEEALHYTSTVDIDPETCHRVEQYTLLELELILTNDDHKVNGFINYNTLSSLLHDLSESYIECLEQAPDEINEYDFTLDQLFNLDQPKPAHLYHKEVLALAAEHFHVIAQDVGGLTNQADGARYEPRAQKVRTRTAILN